MKNLYFILSKLIFIQFILLQSIIGKSDLIVPENLSGIFELQKQFVSSQNCNEFEYLISIEDCEEEQDQCFTYFNSFHKNTPDQFNCGTFPVMGKHIQNIILFESDNSPPYLTKA